MQCSTCDNEMYSYYGAWCPQCEKPQYKPTEYLNLLQSLYHVDRVCFGVKSQSVDAPGRQNLWSVLCDYSYIRNDCFVNINFSTLLDDAQEFGNGLNEEGIIYLEAFVKTFDLDNERNVLWEISW